MRDIKLYFCTNKAIPKDPLSKNLSSFCMVFSVSLDFENFKDMLLLKADMWRTKEVKGLKKSTIKKKKTVTEKNRKSSSKDLTQGLRDECGPSSIDPCIVCWSVIRNGISGMLTIIKEGEQGEKVEVCTSRH